VDIVREPAWQRTLDGDFRLDMFGIDLDGYGTETAYRVGTGFRDDNLLGRRLYCAIVIVIIIVITIRDNGLHFIVLGRQALIGRLICPGHPAVT
jgi:hypothetical protein